MYFKCPILLTDFNQIWSFSTYFRKFHENAPSVGAALIHAERQTDRHDEANRRYSLPTRQHLIKLCNRQARIKCGCFSVSSDQITSATRCLVFCDPITSMLDPKNVTTLLWLIGTERLFVPFSGDKASAEDVWHEHQFVIGCFYFSVKIKLHKLTLKTYKSSSFSQCLYYKLCE